MRGLQDQREYLRHGRARRSLPRPDHPLRVRSAVPVLQQGMLRLLRPEGNTERRLARELVHQGNARDADDSRARAAVLLFRQRSHEDRF